MTVYSAPSRLSPPCGRRRRGSRPIAPPVGYRDGYVYVSNKGKVSLLEADAKGWKIAGRSALPGDPEQEPLAHPVACGGRLFGAFFQAAFPLV